MTFEEWFNELEGYATRGERFGDDWVLAKSGVAMGKDWLHAAYNAGVREGSKQPVPLTVTTVPHIKYPTQDNPFPYPQPLPTPFPRPMPTTPPTQPVWPGVRSCSKCGIRLDGVMGYVCSDQTCPTFRHVWSGTITGTITSGGTGPYFGGSSNLKGVK